MRLPAEPFYLTSRDDRQLYARCWHTQKPAKGVLGIVHGLGEHSGRYEYLADQLTQHQFAVFAFDHRGHGKSPGQRGHVETYDAVLNDITCLLEKMTDANPAAPRFLLGQSLGGNLVINYLLRRTPKLSAAVALSPLILPAFQLPVWQQQTGRLLNRLWPRYTFQSGLSACDLSHDEEAVHRYEADPLVHSFVSARLGATMLAAGRWALAHADQLDIPLLLMHGTDDRITSCDASRKFAEVAGRQCTLKLWGGLYHELLWEKQRDDSIRFLIQWLHADAK